MTNQLTLNIRNNPFLMILLLAVAAANSAIVVLFAKESNFVYLYVFSLVSLFAVALLLTDIKTAFFLAIMLRALTDFQNSFLTNLSIMSLNPSGILSLIVILSGIFYIFVNRINLLSLPLSKPFLVLLILALISILLSTKMADGFTDWLRLLSLYIIYAVFTCAIKNRQDIKKLITLLLVSIIVPSIAAFYQLFTGTGNLETRGFNRLMGTFAHPMQYSYYLLFIITILLVLTLESKRKALLLWALPAYLILGVLLYNTYTRAAWIGLVAALLILGYLRYRKLLYIVPVLLLVVTVFFPSSFSARFEDLNLTEERAAGEWGNSLDSRFGIWGDTAPLFLQNPVIGNGYGTSSTVTIDATHNDYLKMLAEVGMLGFGAFLWLLFAMIRFGWNSFISRKSTLFKSLALVFFVQAIILAVFSFDSNMLRNIALQWAFWALAAAVYKSAMLEKETNNQALNSLKFA